MERLQHHEDLSQLVAGINNLVCLDLLGPAGDQQERLENLVRVRTERDQGFAARTILRVEPVLHGTFVRSCQRDNSLDRGVGSAVLAAKRHRNGVNEALLRKNLSGNRPIFSVSFW